MSRWFEQWQQLLQHRETLQALLEGSGRYEYYVTDTYTCRTQVLTHSDEDADRSNYSSLDAFV